MDESRTQGQRQILHKYLHIVIEKSLKDDPDKTRKAWWDTQTEMKTDCWDKQNNKIPLTDLI